MDRIDRFEAHANQVGGKEVAEFGGIVGRADHGDAAGGKNWPEGGVGIHGSIIYERGNHR